jgi:hypothetical protein
MTTHFITAEIALPDMAADSVATDLNAAVQAELRQQGEPLRWAITGVTAGKAQVEAVVTVGH